MSVPFGNCQHSFGHTDAARRMADNINMHFQAIGWNAVGHFIAIRLSDGSSDNALYDTYRDAVRFNWLDKVGIFKILPMAMGICEAQILLEVHRKASDAGHNWLDPDHPHGGKPLIVRGRANETVASMLLALPQRRR